VGTARGKEGKLADITGPGITDRWGVTCADLGASVIAPNGTLVSVFGDTFSGNRVGDGDWRTPVILIGTGDARHPITYHRAGGGNPALFALRHPELIGLTPTVGRINDDVAVVIAHLVGIGRLARAQGVARAPLHREIRGVHEVGLGIFTVASHSHSVPLGGGRLNAIRTHILASECSTPRLTCRLCS